MQAAYSPQCWYWEIINILYRLTIMVFLPAALYSQPAIYPINIIVSVIALQLQQSYRPMDSREDNSISEAGLVQILLTTINSMSVQFNSDLDNSIIGVLLIVLNLAIFAFVIKYIIKDARKALRTKEKGTNKWERLEIEKKCLNVIGNFHDELNFRGTLNQMGNESIILLLEFISERIQTQVPEHDLQ